VLHLSYNTSNAIQYAFEHTHLQRIWHRVYYDGDWTDWGVVYDKEFVSQQTGNSTTRVMSQKAVTDEFSSLGTAATRDVGESSGDVMEVGAFGIGGTANVAPSQSEEFASLPGGIYAVNSASSGYPT